YRLAATYEQRRDAHFVGSRLGDDEVIPRGAGQMVAPQLVIPRRRRDLLRCRQTFDSDTCLYRAGTETRRLDSHKTGQTHHTVL
ncbi:MAG TPA: hypothetical protein PKM59_13220, partial [Thermodesulfobacteriota bacterium]|nr:hypothetical protein [Thermodesulfobacteriota bacterium]